MFNLLSANFHRLFKDRSFYTITICLVAWSIFSVFMNLLNSNAGFNTNVPLLGFFIALICSLFVSKDYVNSTIRNKIISGYKREEIFMANFLTCTTVSLAYMLITLIFHYALTLPITKTSFGSAEQIFWTVVNMIFVSLAYAAAFNCFSMLLKSRTSAVIICLSAILIITSITPVITHYLMQIENAGIRLFLQFIMDFFPSGQTVQILSGIAKNSLLMLLYSLGIIVTTNIAGLLLFHRCELK